MKKLLEIYESVLCYAGLSVDKGGFVSIANRDKPEPAFVDGKRLVMPTLEQLRSGDIADKTVFHPLYEVPWKAETAVQKKFLQAVNLKLNASIASVTIALLRLASSPAQHAALTPEQSQFLYGIPVVDEKTLAEFTTAMNAQLKTSGAERTFVNLYIRRGGSKGGKKYARLGVVTWLFYDKLCSEQKTFKISEKRIDGIKQIMSFMFPDIAEPEAYSYGTDCNVAPYFKALMYTAAMISARLNELVNLYRPFITNPEAVLFDESCLEELKDLAKLSNEIQMIPSQEEGSVESNPTQQLKSDEPPWDTQSTQQQAPVRQTQVAPPPQPLPVKPAQPPAMDLRSFNNAIQSPVMPPQNAWMYGPGPGMQQNTWGQLPPPPPPGWNSAPPQQVPGGWNDGWQNSNSGWGSPQNGWGQTQNNSQWMGGGYNNPSDPMVRTVYGFMPRSQALMRGCGYSMT